MEDSVKGFLASGKLEEYVFGTLDAREEKEVLSYIKKYPEVNREYQILQDQLESISRKQSIKVPDGMKSQILDSLPNKTKSTPSSKVSWSTYLVAIGVIASILLAWAWKNTKDQLQSEKVNYAQLAKECDQREAQIESQRERIAFLNSEQTQRYDMSGNGLAPEFGAAVFVNTSFGKAIVTPFNSIELPKNKCLQLWGDLDGEMVPIAVLNDISQKDYNVQINPSFTSLNLTIEEKTTDGKGQDHPDVSQLIASVII